MNPYLLIVLVIICIFFAVELILHFILMKLREKYSLIRTGADKAPKLDRKGLIKFLESGYDSELGWVRKPNTSKTEDSFSGKKTWHVNSKGSRVNPGHEKLKTKIITFGDSFTFNREVNDDETWQYYLANMLKINVANFGVGNYGLDQSFLRFKRELPNYKGSKFVIMGVVPDAIVRNLSLWKHYIEYGNTFAFKPKFILENNNLKLILNPADKKEYFYDVKKILPIVNKYDYFYESFKKSLFTFPYTISILKNPRRKLLLLFSYSAKYLFEILKIDWRKFKTKKLESTKKQAFGFIVDSRIMGFKDKEISKLTLVILKEFARVAKKEKMTPVFLLMPQKEDLDYILKKKKIYYQEFVKEVKKFMSCINFSEAILKLKDPLSVFPSKKFSDSYIVYGGHYNTLGNKLVAKEIKKFITKKKIKLK